MKQKRLEDKVAIITGASSGIGRATAISMAGEGSRVVLASRRREKLEEVKREIEADGGEALIIPTDVVQRDQVKNLVKKTMEHFGRIDLIVCNAGIYFHRSVQNTTIEDIERVMAVDFYGVLYLIYEVLSHMLEKKSGHIVVISSVDGKRGLPLDSAYVASKFAVAGFTEVLRQELYGTGISVSTIFPGRVDTPMIADLEVPWISAKIPPEWVAKAIVDAILKKKIEVYVPYLSSKTLVLLNILFPRLADWAVRVFHLEGKKIHGG